MGNVGGVHGYRGSGDWSVSRGGYTGSDPYPGSGGDGSSAPFPGSGGWSFSDGHDRSDGRKGSGNKNSVIE
jgi:hypothetical protein